MSRSGKKILIWSSVSAVSLVLGVMLAAAFLVLDSAPLVRADRAIDSLDFRRAERLIRRAQYALGDDDPSATVSATKHDLDSLASFAARSVDGLSATVDVAPDTIRFVGSYDVGWNPFGRYANVVLDVRPSEIGFEVAGVDLGHLHLGPRLGRLAVDFGLSQILGSTLGTDLVHSVDGISVENDIVTLRLTPDTTIEERLKMRVAHAVSETPPAIVGVYYRQIMQIASTYDHFRPVPFVEFFQPLLAEAKKRSEQSDPVTELRGAVLAFAIYVGGKRLEDIRKTVLPKDLARLPRPYARYIVLRGHHDHLQHFIVSAALTLSGGARFTTVIGEAKELDDLRRGGEDFSLQDLAADRAGIAFAQLAETPSGARHLEDLGERPKSEALFFPDVSDLPDSMSPARFNAVYQDISSPAFKAVLADIDRRIRGCEAYR